MPYYRKCVYCGANNDPCERCDCPGVRADETKPANELENAREVS